MSRSIIPLAALLLAAGPALAQEAGDPAAGERVFGQCRACHTVNAGGRNGVGPNLHGVVGRKAATAEGFRYSNAMKEKGEQGWTWTEENLRPYLRNPKEVVPGTNMSFPGLKKDQQINDLIAYLVQQGS